MTVTVPYGTQTPTVTFTATLNGAAVPPRSRWATRQIGSLGAPAA